MTSYRALEPPPRTPPGDICRCRSLPAVKLVSRLDFNPIACVRCNLEVPPRRLRLDRAAVQEIAHWNSLYDALDRLWLDSGAYESWAARQLGDLRSEVNLVGRAACRTMQRFRRCYYELFQDLRDQERGLPARCPSCKRVPTRFDGFRIPQLLCRRCSLIWWAESSS
jgi:predicted  nucleic acid-binding Zn ribbon protein